MKHEVTTLLTKKALAASLKKLMAKKPLSKVTIQEIVQDCGVNRKTFYYHFEDISALLMWMFDEEAVEVVKQFDLLVNYQDAILFVMDYVEENAHILNCAYDYMGREQMKRFFCNDFLGLIRTVIEGFEGELAVHVSEDFRNFLCYFYTEALAGMLIDWIQAPKTGGKEQSLEFLSLIYQHSLPEILKNAPMEKPAAPR